MKLPATNLSSFKKFINPTLVLALMFIALVALEAYVLYYKVYGNLSTGIDDSVDVNIVRLDVNNYNKMIELIDSLKAFEPHNEARDNPFN
ncbi:MAG: hypothetical protein KW804_01150 [Candidatus Doudnabacteria bacterium]|nr:hypothetical protein [Candidatus Doudnabacteria bacterium]